LDEKKKDDKAGVIKAIANQEGEFVSADTGDVIGLDSIDGVNVLVRVFEPEASLKTLASQAMLILVDRIKEKIGSGIVFIATCGCEKDIFICSATDDIIKKGFSCKKFISESGKGLSLTGGGNDKKVQGSMSSRVDDFIDKVKEAISKFIKK